MRYEVIPRQYSVIILDDDSQVNYRASCQVFVYGDVGMIYAFSGEDFYTHFAEFGRRVMQECGVRSLEGYVSDAHARLMRYQLRRWANVEVTHRGIMAGHEMPWVRVTAKA